MATLASRQWRQQRGAALIISLVLLMVLTVLGVATMNTATLELAMAGNMQQQQYAFQAAESAMDVALAETADIVVDETTAPGDVVDTIDDYQYKADALLVATATAGTTFRGISAAPPGSGWEFGTMSALHFQVAAEANTTGQGARSLQRSGFYVMAPSQ